MPCLEYYYELARIINPTHSSGALNHERKPVVALHPR